MLGSENKGYGQAMFDVKPVDESGALDVRKIDTVQPVVNLSSFRPKKSRRQNVGTSISGTEAPERIKSRAPTSQSLPPVIGLPSRQDIKEQFNELMSHDLDLGIELAKVGLQAVNSNQGKPRYRVIKNRPLATASDLYAPLISEIQQSAKTISREETSFPPASMFEPNELSESAQTAVQSFFTVPAVRLTAPKKSAPKLFRIKHWPEFKMSKHRLIIIAGIVAVLAILIGYGLHVKRQVVQQSATAVASLQTAHADLKALDFKNAAQDFFSAYADFSKAGDSLNVFGAGITDILSTLTGGSTLKSAKNLVQVGQLLSAAGTSMTTALGAVVKTGALSDPSHPQLPVGPIVTALKKALLASQQQVAQANALMADIDNSIIPADKQAGFDDLKAKLPELEAGMNMSADYAKFFENLVNASGYQRYLVMFQNASELRPTGGFPGTYGVVSFKDGKLDNLSVDDVYNLDGQLKENIIPPLQMQHITPTWGMRDSNWYVDFPASARNIEAFYKKETRSTGSPRGDSVDGVIVVNPALIQKILEIVGPIEMPDYKLTLDSKNILTTIQSQVEYGANRAQPKQIIKDFTPLLLNKIYTAGSDKWLAIFNTLVLGMNQKDMLMSFDNLSLESFVTDKGLGGQVQQATGMDYVMPVITNVKGSKTDAVTDTSISIDTKFENDVAVHTLTITRQHNGGGEKFGFYNKQNPAYVRVLVPDGSELVSVTGNDKPDFSPLINYSKDKSFTRDDTLLAFETSGTTNTATGVTTYRESGKTEFGFWLITDAGKSKTVTVTYRVSKALTDKSYSLYVQKQPALKIKDFKFSLQKSANLIPDASSPLLTSGDTAYTYSNLLENDLTIKVNFK